MSMPRADLVASPSRSTLSIQTVSPLVATLTGFEAVLREEVTLDLSGVRFVCPSGLVALATYVDAAASDGIRVSVVSPMSGDCCEYMAAAGVLQYCARVGDVVGAAGREAKSSSQSGTVLALHVIETESDAEQARLEVERGLHRVLGSGGEQWEGVRKAVAAAVHEMCANIAYHARARRGFVIAQKYFNRYQQRHWVEFAVGDAGIGIRESLSEAYPELASAPEHLVLGRMMTERLTRRQAYGGNGYFTLQRAVREHNGTLTLHSGRGQAILRPRQGKPQLSVLTSHWPGTMLAASIDCG